MRKIRTKRQQDGPNLRSVGAKVYDFNRLKYTTSYRAFGRRSLPNLEIDEGNEGEKEIININLRSSAEKDKQYKIPAHKKIAVIVDKWKQRYEKPDDHEHLRRRSFDLLPVISKNGPPLVMISTHQKFNALKKMSGGHLNRDTQSLQKMELVGAMGKQKQPGEARQIFHKYDASHQKTGESARKTQESRERKLRYALYLDRKVDHMLRAKKSMTGLQSLKAVEEMPERWQVNLQQDWT